MAVLLVFLLVYLGMFFGRMPGLRLDRTGFALLGAIALVVLGAVTTEEAVRAVDVPTLALLFSLMVVSAQLRLGGFYAHAARRLATLPLTPPKLLAILIVAVAALSAVFSNDIICLAVTPVLIHVCRQRRLDPLPFLIGLACAANLGSAATLIGNPQNMLIGQVLRLSFVSYLRDAALPVAIGLAIAWAVIAWQARGRWWTEGPAGPPTSGPSPEVALDRWQALKGLLVTAALLAGFLLSPWPRETMALGGAGLLLLSRRLHSRSMLGLVDWPLLVLFIGLFVVNHALLATGLPDRLVTDLAERGVAIGQTAWLFWISALLSNLVSNVPATMLLLPIAGPGTGLALALSSTFAGNLLVVGSIANIIVVESAARENVILDWKRHARTGVPVTLLSLAAAAALVAMMEP